MKRNVLLIAAVLPLAACATEPGSTAAVRAPAVTVAGAPVDCIPTSRINNIVVHDDYTLDFKMLGGDIYRNTLPNRCFNLGFEQRIVYEASAGQICRIEMIRVLQPGAGTGPGCSLGQFVPVRYAEAG